ncbi:MAG TPA: LETM1 domain-containing protein [Anaeromyxobacteraceae bacterium]|nr:LETM1 domain-containing protein [Anaeromyxobacteraceae bacterium]
MALDIQTPTWLGELVDRELADYDPVEARLRIPPDLRDAGSPLEARARMLARRSIRHRRAPDREAAAQEAFLERATGHLRLLLDVALLGGSPFEPSRRRAELACLLAALSGRFRLAAAADPGRADGGSEAAVRRALEAAAAAQRQAAWPSGDPRGGLLLSAGALRLERWLLSALASDYYALGRFEEGAVRRRLGEAARDLVLLVEALAAQAATAGRLDLHRRRQAQRQAGRLRLAGDLKARLRQRLRRPRGAAELAGVAPPPLRAFLLEQILLTEAVTSAPGPGAAAFSDAFAAAASIAAEPLAAMRAEAALRASEQLLLEGPLDGTPGEWLADGWGEVTDQLTERVTRLVTDNLDAIVAELKQTGELGQLLAKAAAGKALSREEKVKVRAQLVDLAKAVPALAIFAAPGGLLLLPLLAKLLPFKLLPSAWERKRDGPGSGEPGDR